MSIQQCSRFILFARRSSFEALEAFEVGRFAGRFGLPGNVGKFIITTYRADQPMFECWEGSWAYQSQ